MQLLFQLQDTPPDAQVRFVAFHLTDAAQHWYTQMMQEAPLAYWAAFTESLLHEFGHLPDQHVGNDFTQYSDRLNDYIDAFRAYAAHVGITSEPHRVNLFISSLPHQLWEAVTAYRPQEMEAAILLARGLDDTAATHVLASPACVLVQQHH